jgi:hypothetical protein
MHIIPLAGGNASSAPHNLIATTLPELLRESHAEVMIITAL